MLHTYFKIAWRNALTHRLTTALTITGLTLGLTACLLISTYVLDSLSYDRFHRNADRIVLFQQFENAPGSGGQFASDLRQKFSQVSDAVRLTRRIELSAGRIVADAAA